MDDETKGPKTPSGEESMAAAGGKARAAKLSPEERSAMAKHAALDRWARKDGLPSETHVGTLPLGNIPCAVLDNGMRVLSTRGIGRAFESKKTGTRNTGTGAPQLPPFLEAQNLSDSIPADLRLLLMSPVVFRMRQGGKAYGYVAELLPRICGVILDAKRDHKLKKSQEYLVRAAETLLRGLATVGIVALVDEATGYQADRARWELHKILQAYVAEEIRQWVAVFPHEFFRQVYRLQSWEYRPGNMKHPGYVGRLINDWIYKRLPPPVLPELRRRNPTLETGRRKYRHHQLLTDHTGIPDLDAQIRAVIAVMRLSKDKRHFEENLAIAFPITGDQLTLAIETAAKVQLPEEF